MCPLYAAVLNFITQRFFFFMLEISELLPKGTYFFKSRNILILLFLTSMSCISPFCLIVLPKTSAQFWLKKVKVDIDSRSWRKYFKPFPIYHDIGCWLSHTAAWYLCFVEPYPFNTPFVEVLHDEDKGNFIRCFFLNLLRLWHSLHP